MQMNGDQRLIAILFAGKPPLSPLSRLSGRQASPRSTIILHLEDTLLPHFHQPDTCPSHTPLPYAIQTVMIAGTPFTNPTSQLHHLKKIPRFLSRHQQTLHRSPEAPNHPCQTIAPTNSFPQSLHSQNSTQYIWSKTNVTHFL